MEWTKEDREALLAIKGSLDSDDIKIKEKIKQVLLNNRYIVHVLNNKELEENDAEPDDYFGVNILPYYMINPTQTNIQNFICYEVSYDEVGRWNPAIKTQQIIFYILCHHNNLIDEETGMARHDLLASILQTDFNYTNYFGKKITLVSNVPSVVDTHYACRTLIFEQTVDNNLVKTRKSIPMLANKETHIIG